MNRMSWTLMAFLAVACTTAERPPAVTALDSIRQSPSVQQSRRTAPQAYSEAEQLAEQADVAWQKGDQQAAEHLAAIAAAAYQQALALSRRARAEDAAADAARSVDKLRSELSELASQQAKLEAETSDLELQVKVLQDAKPLAPVEPATPARQQARRVAARAWLTEAKLLCVAESLVVGERSSATSALSDRIAEVLEGSGPSDDSKLVEEARRLRGACLERLTLARRPATREAPQAGRADVLLARLSQVEGLHPFRDDRGVVVMLSAPASSAGLTPATRSKLQDIAKVVADRTDFSLLVVWHSAAGSAKTSNDGALLDEALRILEPSGSRRVARELVGSALPLVDPTVQGAEGSNFRMEIVFVTPTNS